MFFSEKMLFFGEKSPERVLPEVFCTISTRMPDRIALRRPGKDKRKNVGDNRWKVCKLFIKQRKNVDKFRITSLFVDKSDFMQPLTGIPDL